jgi:signal transduction histidine kinase
MPSAPPTKTSSSTLGPLIGAVVLVVTGFLAAAIFAEVQASAIDREAEQLEANALPSVEHLTAARAALWRLEAAGASYVSDPPEKRDDAERAIQAARATVDRELNTEFATEVYPGEAPLQVAATRALGEVDRLAERARQVDDHGDATQRSFAEHALQDGITQADNAIERLVALNATEGRAEAARIAAVRASSVRLMLGLNLGCIAFAAVVAVVALRAARRQRSLELAHDELLELRADDLERFASRVAHDLLSPLSALSFTLSSLKRNADKGLPITEPFARAGGCLKRAQGLVEGVMDFARAGGAPGGGRANLRATLDGVLEEARTDGGEADLVVEPFDSELFVACSAGVLTSILSNLVRNALKYMDPGRERRVTVRVLSSATNLRVEVQDTGPGLPAGLEQHVFEPYVRSSDNAKPGLGLGLATVERFVESHRGRVGVQSSPGEGCVFWFELPRAEGVSER